MQIPAVYSCTATFEKWKTFYEEKLLQPVDLHALEIKSRPHENATLVPVFSPPTIVRDVYTLWLAKYQLRAGSILLDQVLSSEQTTRNKCEVQYAVWLREHRIPFHGIRIGEAAEGKNRPTLIEFLLYDLMYGTGKKEDQLVLCSQARIQNRFVAVVIEKNIVDISYVGYYDRAHLPLVVMEAH